MSYDMMGLLGAVVTAVVTFLIARMRVQFSRQKFYENKVSEILQLQSLEIKELKQEIQKLVRENQWLRHQLEREYHYNENTIENVNDSITE